MRTRSIVSSLRRLEPQEGRHDRRFSFLDSVRCFHCHHRSRAFSEILAKSAAAELVAIAPAGGERGGGEASRRQTADRNGGRGPQRGGALALSTPLRIRG